MTDTTAYPGGETQRTALIASLEQHRVADRISRGHFWRGGTGCSVGCALASLGEIAAAERGDHALLGKLTGYGEALQRLNDNIFEALPDAVAQHWPVRFATAAQVGADLSLVAAQFTHQTLARLYAQPWIDAGTRTMVQPILDGLAVIARGAALTPEQKSAGDSAARDVVAAEAARAAWAAEDARAARAAWAAWAAGAAWAAWAAGAAGDAEAIAQADGLIALIEAAPKGDGT